MNYDEIYLDVIVDFQPEHKAIAEKVLLLSREQKGDWGRRL